MGGDKVCGPCDYSQSCMASTAVTVDCHAPSRPLAQLSATGSLAKLSVRYVSDAAELAIASALAANPAPPKCAVQLS